MALRLGCVRPDSPSAAILRLPRPAAAPSIVDLRKLLAARFPQQTFPRATHIAPGISAIDEAVGGLPKGGITEVVSPHTSAGSAWLISALLGAAHRDGYFLALVDGGDSFDPEPLGNARLRNLLWIRCTRAIDAVKAADLLLRDGNFPLVILDLVLNATDELRRIPQTHWYRLQRLVEPAPMAFVVLTRRSMISSAQLKIVLENQWTLKDLAHDYVSECLKFRVERSHRMTRPLAQTG